MAKTRKTAKRRPGADESGARVLSLLRTVSEREERAPVDLPFEPGVRIGTLVHIDSDGHFWAELSPDERAPYTLKCLATAALGAGDVGTRVIVWEAHDSLGVVFGRNASPMGLADSPIDAQIDGRRVVLDAADEIVLRCGRASLTLRRNGRVVIKGAHVETSSEGVNRIKGGTVQIN